MKSRLLIAVFLSFMLFAREAHAVFDFVALLQTVMKHVDEVKKQVEEVKNSIEDAKEKLKQGFLGEICNYLPELCGSGGSQITPITGVVALEGSGLDEGDIAAEDPTDLAKKISDTYIYKKGQDKSLDTQKSLAENINATIVKDISVLFAKAMATHQSIIDEDSQELYPYENATQSSETILSSQNKVVLNSQKRLSRILEIRAYMITAVDSLELKNKIKHDVEE